MTGVVVIGEHRNGQLDATTAEALAAGAPLARELNKGLSLLLLGQDVEPLARKAIALGAERVYSIQHPTLCDPTPEVATQAQEQACRQIAPDIVLFGRTVAGRDLAPRLAFRLGVGLLQDCVELRLDPQNQRLVGSRPVFGGNVIAQAISVGSPQIATIRPKMYEPSKEDPARTGDILLLEVDLDPQTAKTRVLERRQHTTEGIRLENARVVVAGGRGIGGHDGFKQIEELAGLLGGAVGVSRIPVDMGWAPLSTQIGLTGKTVSPELYIAVGLSGASQHLSGVAGKRVKIAINTDEEARIFDLAAYGVVGDWRQVVPAFVDKVRELGISSRNTPPKQ
jgi:electron transfer flavoprotein alpha subunit